MDDWKGMSSASWEKMEYLFPRKKSDYYRARRLGGRPRLNDRKLFGALLWYVRTGGPWTGLPARFGSADTARRRAEEWWANGRLQKAWREYLWSVSPEERASWKACLTPPPYTDDNRLWLFDFEYVYKLEFL